MKTERFTITEQRLKLLRHAYIRWNDREFGAPTCDATELRTQMTAESSSDSAILDANWLIQRNNDGSSVS